MISAGSNGRVGGTWPPGPRLTQIRMSTYPSAIGVRSLCNPGVQLLGQYPKQSPRKVVNPKTRLMFGLICHVHADDQAFVSIKIRIVSPNKIPTGGIGVREKPVNQIEMVGTRR